MSTANVNGLSTMVLLILAGQGVALGNHEASVRTDFYLLPRHIVPVHYDVRLIPHIVEDNFTCNGETWIDVNVLEATDVIVLHIRDLAIDESQTRLIRKVEDNENDAVQNYVPKRHYYIKQVQMLSLRFDELLETDAYKLYLKFVGTIRPRPRGFYRSFYTDREGTKKWLALTHLQPDNARRVFPCWDEPAMKATFKFSIKHHPNFTALSNMPSVRSEVDEADGKVWSHFRTTPVMPTNVLGFVIADYDHISNPEDTTRMWAPKHMLELAVQPLVIVEKAMRELEEFTNSTVVVPKMDHVVAPVYSTRATENWGMIVYKLDTLFYNESDPLGTDTSVINFFMRPIDLKMYNTMTITHELAHQWFGNLVSPIWWSHLWLSEGISTYLKYYITDKFVKEWRVMDFFVLDSVQRLLASDVGRVQPITKNITTNPYEAYTGNTYTKSAILLHMISHVLREDVFRNGLIKYLRANAYGNTTPDDLWRALQEALDESDVPHDDFDVKEVMDTWFSQASYPVVTVTRDYTNGDVKVTQSRSGYGTLNVEKNNATWWIPLNFATRTNVDFSSTLATHWLRPQDEAVTIAGVNVDDWIVVNKQLTGYYRVNYDTTNWKRIAAFLNSDEYTKIPVLNRAQIIDDAFFMMKTDQLDVVTFLEIMNYLSRETDYVAWQPALKVIKDLDIYLRIPEGGATFRSYVFNLTSEVIENVGFNDRLDDNVWTIKTRSLLGEYACTYGYTECQLEATAKLLAYVEDPIANSISYNYEWIFCFGLMRASDAVWERFLEAQDKTLEYHLKFIGCTENMDIVVRVINYITVRDMEDNLFMKDTYYNRIFSNVFKNPLNIDRAIDFFTNNSDRFAAIMSKKPILKMMIKHSLRDDQIEKLKIFAEHNRINISGLLTDKERGLTRARDNLAKVYNALENNQFSAPISNTLDNDEP